MMRSTALTRSPDLRRSTYFIRLCIAVLAVVAAGCDRPAVGPEETPAVVQDADHEHGHQHTHRENVAHDHDHGGFDGSHSHDHAHPHRHDGDGERLVSIGHTHHDAGVSDFHARPDEWDGESLTLTLLVDRDGGPLQPVADGPEEFEAIIGSDRNAGLTSRKVTFRPIGGQPGRYAASLADVNTEGANLVLVLVPSIMLDGERLDFSFPLPERSAAAAAAAGSDVDAEAGE